MITSIRVGPMRALDLRDLWNFGDIRQLQLLRETFFVQTPVQEWSHILFGSWMGLKMWMDTASNKQEYPESYTCAERLSQSILRVIRQFRESALPIGSIGEIANRFAAFEEAFRHELGKTPSYILEEKRGFGVQTLVERANKIISSKNLLYLSDFAQQNINDAGRCFVFDCFTATGFHATRALEDVARNYYSLVTGRLPHDTRNGAIYFHGLGRVTNELRDRLNSIRTTTDKHLLKDAVGNLGSVIAFLEQICLVYRDPLSHPDIIALDEDGAADAFFQCVAAISCMLNDVREGAQHVGRISG